MNVRRAVSNLGDGPFGRQAESAQDREILSQTAFHRVISIERRRTERSRKPFLLMLLDMGNHLVVGNERQECQQAPGGTCCSNAGKRTFLAGMRTIVSSA